MALNTEDLKLEAKSTWINLSSAIVLAGLLFQGWSMFRDFSDRLGELEKRVNSLSAPVPIENRWTCLDMERYMNRFQNMNRNTVALPAFPKVCSP